MKVYCINKNCSFYDNKECTHDSILIDKTGKCMYWSEFHNARTTTNSSNPIKTESPKAQEFWYHTPYDPLTVES